MAQDVNTWTFQTTIYNWAWGHIGPEVRIGKSISKNKKWHLLGGYSYAFALNIASGNSEAPLSVYSTNVDYGHEGSLGIMYQFSNRLSLKYLVSIGDYRYKHNQTICIETDQNYDPEIAFCNCLEVASNDFTQQAQRLNVGIELQYTVYQKSSFSIDISGAVFIIGGRRQFYDRLNHNSCPGLNIRPK